MNVPDYEKALMEFLESGKGFFASFQGKNTPNILDAMDRHLGAIEVALKQQQLPPQIEEFAYLSQSTLPDLWAAAQKHIAEGWQPFHGVTVDPSNVTTKYIQAIVKYKPNT
jgi:hypothetical protein